MKRDRYARLFSGNCCHAEQTHVGAEAGIGVLVRIEKAIDVAETIHVSKRNWNSLAGVGFFSIRLCGRPELPKDFYVGTRKASVGPLTVMNIA